MSIELRPLADCDGGHREDGAGEEDLDQDQLRRPPQPQHGHHSFGFIIVYYIILLYHILYYITFIGGRAIDAKGGPPPSPCDPRGGRRCHGMYGYG